MFPVIPGKACIVFVSGVGRKIVQVSVTFFLQVSIPVPGLVYQFCNFFIHFVLQNGHKKVCGYVIVNIGASAPTRWYAHTISFTSGERAVISVHSIFMVHVMLIPARIAIPGYSAK